MRGATAGRALTAAATAAHLARGSVLGVTWAYALLGVATVAQDTGWGASIRVLAAATAFHVAVYVWNDLVDLPLDRTEPRRARSPLVRGTVSTRAAAVVSCSAAGLALLLLAPDGDAVAALAVALALLGAYDLWGKRSALPPLTDVVQGFGWAALVWSGAAAAGQPSALTAWLAAAVAVVVVLVNGVVGAGRDLANDERHGARTTALLLGASAAGGAVHLSRALRVYAVVLHVTAVAVVLAAVASAGSVSAVRIAVVVGVGVLGLVALVVALTAAEPTSWAAGLAHIVLMVLLPYAAVPALTGPLAAGLAVLAITPWAGSGWVRGRLRALWVRHAPARTRVAT